jgi:hypothetical protein
MTRVRRAEQLTAALRNDVIRIISPGPDVSHPTDYDELKYFFLLEISGLVESEAVAMVQRAVFDFLKEHWLVANANRSVQS